MKRNYVYHCTNLFWIAALERLFLTAALANIIAICRSLSWEIIHSERSFNSKNSFNNHLSDCLYPPFFFFKNCLVLPSFIWYISLYGFPLSPSYPFIACEICISAMYILKSFSAIITITNKKIN